MSKYIDFGTVTVSGNEVKVFSTSQGAYTTIYVKEEVVNASWSGDIVNVTLKSGKVRQYKTSQTYSTL